MSQENEALVREAYEAYSRGDTARLLQLIHPNLEWTYLDPADADPQPQICHGRGDVNPGAAVTSVANVDNGATARTPGDAARRASGTGFVGFDSVTTLKPPDVSRVNRSS